MIISVTGSGAREEKGGEKVIGQRSKIDLLGFEWLICACMYEYVSSLAS